MFQERIPGTSLRVSSKTKLIEITGIEWRVNNQWHHIHGREREILDQAQARRAGGERKARR
jgi:hypothetical protein